MIRASNPQRQYALRTRSMSTGQHDGLLNTRRPVRLLDTISLAIGLDLTGGFKIQSSFEGVYCFFPRFLLKECVNADDRLRARVCRFRRLPMLRCILLGGHTHVRPCSDTKIRQYFQFDRILSFPTSPNAERRSLDRTNDSAVDQECTLGVKFDGSSSLATASSNISVATASHFLKIGISLNICFVWVSCARRYTQVRNKTENRPTL